MVRQWGSDHSGLFINYCSTITWVEVDCGGQESCLFTSVLWREMGSGVSDSTHSAAFTFKAYWHIQTQMPAKLSADFWPSPRIFICTAHFSSQAIPSALHDRKDKNKDNNAKKVTKLKTIFKDSKSCSSAVRQWCWEKKNPNTDTNVHLTHTS